MATFSILAVGSFPQTRIADVLHSASEHFQYPRCWIVSSDRHPLITCALNDTPFSILAVGSFPQTLSHRGQYRKRTRFQYPRCWIVSSDKIRLSPRLNINELSVSSLLDRFLRRSPGTFGRLRLPVFQYPRCWIVSSDTPEQANLA